MKLIMTLLVRNEEDILEVNLDYHLAQGVDHVIVTDHGSTDATRDLLAQYERGGMVTVLREEGDENHQSIRVTRMARLAYEELSADWIIHTDADEFWWPLAGSLRDVFSAIPADFQQIIVQRRNFLPRPDDQAPFYSRLTLREFESLNLIGQPLEPKVAHRAHPDVVLPHGNHRIEGVEFRPLPYPEALEIFHYPMRSFAQFTRKVIQTGTGLERLPFRSPGVGRDQLKLLEIHRAGQLREHYEEALLNESEVDQGLRNGKLVIDDRLAAFVRTHVSQRTGTIRPDGPPMRTLLNRSLHAQSELEQAQVDLAQTRAAFQAVRSDAAAAQADAAASIERLRAEEGALRRELHEARSLSGAARTVAIRLGIWEILVRIPGLRGLWRRARVRWSRARSA